MNTRLMSAKIAAMLLATTFIVTPSINATDLPVQPINGQVGQASVQMQLRYCGNLQVELHLRNKASVPISFNASIYRLTECQFEGFPRAGALQLKSNNKTIELGGERPDGWWHPRILSSTLPTPKFAPRGAPPAPVLEDFKPFELPAGGEKVIQVDCRMILRETLRHLKNSQPGQKAEFCRVGFNIKVAGIAGANHHFIFSDWFSLSDGETPVRSQSQEPEIR